MQHRPSGFLQFSVAIYFVNHGEQIVFEDCMRYSYYLCYIYKEFSNLSVGEKRNYVVSVLHADLTAKKIEICLNLPSLHSCRFVAFI